MYVEAHRFRALGQQIDKPHAARHIEGTIVGVEFVAAPCVRWRWCKCCQVALSRIVEGGYVQRRKYEGD